MSKITYNNESAQMPIYATLLRDKISAVCQKTSFDDSQVVWVIFDAASFYSNKLSHSILVGTRGRDYGFFDLDTHEIWISTKAIKSTQPSSTSIVKKTMPPSVSRCESDVLADVLLDEITHFQTEADHGEVEYDRKLRENREKYYGICF